ncbi:MAG: TIGR00266 family protein [Bacteriovoracaceae bacterium]
MNFNIEANPDYAFLTLKLDASEKVKVEASSMASTDTNVSMKTKLKGGLGRFLTKESLFINEFQAEGGPGEVTVAPGPSGDIGHYCLNGREKFYLTASSFLASAMTVEQNTKWQGFAKGFFSGESFFLIECFGEGDIWFNCYGALFEVDVKGEYVVDTGHIVAFQESLDYQISKIGGYKSLFFSGEGFVARFRGEGKVWIQTKSPMGLVAWADYYRRIERQNN